MHTLPRRRNSITFEQNLFFVSFFFFSPAPPLSQFPSMGDKCEICCNSWALIRWRDFSKTNRAPTSAERAECSDGKTKAVLGAKSRKLNNWSPPAQLFSTVLKISDPDTLHSAHPTALMIGWWRRLRLLWVSQCMQHLWSSLYFQCSVFVAAVAVCGSVRQCAAVASAVNWQRQSRGGGRSPRAPASIAQNSARLKISYILLSITSQ